MHCSVRFYVRPDADFANRFFSVMKDKLATTYFILKFGTDNATDVSLTDETEFFFQISNSVPHTDSCATTTD